MEKIVSPKVWFSRYIPEIGKDFSEADAKKRVRMFEHLESAVDNLEKAKSTEKVRVDAILSAYNVTDMGRFMTVFVPDADSGLWPCKQDGTRLTPQAVALRVQADKLDGLSEFAIAACLYLRALERGVRRIVAKSKRADSKGADSKGADSKGADSKGADSKGAESAVSARYATLQAQISLLDSIVSGAISALGKADASVVLSAIIAECQSKAQQARLELLKLQGKPVDTGKGKGRAKAIKIFA